MLESTKSPADNQNYGSPGRTEGARSTLILSSSAACLLSEEEKEEEEEEEDTV
jgi:hypothetical protein